LFLSISRFIKSSSSKTKKKQKQIQKMVKSNQMEDRGTNALKTHMSGLEKMEMRQTRRGAPIKSMTQYYHLLYVRVVDMFVI
jgi:hypothetical protein